MLHCLKFQSFRLLLKREGTKEIQQGFTLKGTEVFLKGEVGTSDETMPDTLQKPRSIRCKIQRFA